MSLNLSKVLADALRGIPPLERDCPDPGQTGVPPQEFLHRDVWPLMQQARQALEDKGYLAATVSPVPDDESMTHALLFLDWNPELQNQDAGCLRFMLQQGKLCSAVKVNGRNTGPTPVEPAGSFSCILNIIEDFLHHCLRPSGLRQRKVQKPEKSFPLKRSA